MWVAILNVLLSPFGLLFFFLFSSNQQERYFVSAGTNTSKLKFAPYAVYNLAFTGFVLGITYGVGRLLVDDFNLWETYQPRYFWLSALGWGATLFTLITYFKGMEGNIMGFIFFPMLLLPSLGLLIANVISLFTFTIDLSLPVVDDSYFWLGFLAHAFMPLYMVVAINSENKKENQESVFVILISIMILQLVVFGANWAVISLFGGTISFSSFFGEGASILYFLPMLAGFFYFLMYSLSKNASDEMEKALETLSGYAMIAVIVCSFLQVVNYVQFVRGCF